MGFTHLHCHSAYSLLDGLSEPEEMILRAKDIGQDSIAITDHGYLHGLLKFYKAGRDHGIKPILGVEAYLTSDISVKDKDDRRNNHLILLAKNKAGYKNLLELMSIAATDGKYYQPRIDHQLLTQYHEHLICLSGCIQGEIPAHILGDNYAKALEQAKWYQELFGDDFYLEVMRSNHKQFITDDTPDIVKDNLILSNAREDKYLGGLIDIANEPKIPLVATRDSHYALPDDAKTQDLLLCVQTKQLFDNPSRTLRFIDTPNMYIMSEDEMLKDWDDRPDVVHRTTEISDKCEDPEITLGKFYFPKINSKMSLKEIVWDKATRKYPDVVLDTDIQDRISFELDVISDKGYDDYFLIVMDIIAWCREKNIKTNTRGSVAGSIVSFILGITTVDPLEYGLPFERFLNPERPSLPDIDLDVEDVRRDDVIDYIANRFGEDKVANICSFGRMLSRGSVRDVGRALGYPLNDVNKIARLIPEPKQGFPITISQAMEDVPDLKKLYNRSKEARKLLDQAGRLEGTTRHVTQHPAGVVISPTPITDFVPLETKDDRSITQFEMHDVEDLGLVKFDILGSTSLSILSEVERLSGVSSTDIPLDDKKTYDMLTAGHTYGVFQLSSTGITDVLKELKPNRVEDLMALVALYRPGPMQIIPEYIKRKHDPSLIWYFDPRMKEFLKKSYGLLVYQEDILFTAIKLAGYSWLDADALRKATGKKIPEEMAQQREKFVQGIIDNEREGEHKDIEKFAEVLWEYFIPFAAYSFNSAHAASYGMLSYATGYMKANYPQEYMTAMMSHSVKNTEKINLAIKECRILDIPVLLPDINRSDFGFSHRDDGILFGLEAIKGIGTRTAERLIQNRPYESISDLVWKTGINKPIMTFLIKSGALDTMSDRSMAMQWVDSSQFGEIKFYASEAASGQLGLFDDKTNLTKKQPDLLEGETSGPTIKSWEEETLGISLSFNPQKILKSMVDKNAIDISDIKTTPPNNLIRTTGVVTRITEHTTKKGDGMAFITLADNTGEVDVTVFPKQWDLIQGKIQPETIIKMGGKVDQYKEKLSLVLNWCDTIENDF